MKKLIRISLFVGLLVTLVSSAGNRPTTSAPLSAAAEKEWITLPNSY